MSRSLPSISSIVVPLLSMGLMTGCIKQALLNGQISSTRQASAAFNELSDWELAYNAASAGIVQFEGMHLLAPENRDALFMLARAYSGYAYGFAEDEMESAEDAADDALAAYHRKRATSAYERSIAYGLELWAARGIEGFDQAKASEPALASWLAEHFSRPEDAADLLFVGLSWLLKTNLQKDDAEAVANLWIGAAILERAVALDPAYNAYSGPAALASYHARSATADLAQAKQRFEDLVALTDRKSLLVLFNYATKYACVTGDAALYSKLLTEIETAEYQDGPLRLMNTLAKRRARRWLAPERAFAACSIDLPVDPPAASSSDAPTSSLDRSSGLLAPSGAKYAVRFASPASRHHVSDATPVFHLDSEGLE